MSALGLIAISAGGIVGAADRDYPTRPIRLVMPNAAGSSADTLGRIAAAKLGDALGQPLVVDNRAGAGGVVGLEIGKNAAPDGYTLKLNRTMAQILAMPEMKEVLARQGAEPAIVTPGEFRKAIAEEIVETGKLVKAIGLKGE